MKSRLLIVLGFLAAVGFLTIAGAAQTQQKSPARTLAVKLKYGGSGTVDDKHLIQVFLWDSPDWINGGLMPISIKSAASKTGSVTFSDVDKSPVYASVIYDPKGEYNEVNGPPPSGSSAAMYSKEPGTPAPVKIEAGESVEVEIAFDDSYKLP